MALMGSQSWESLDQTNTHSWKTRAVRALEQVERMVQAAVAFFSFLY